VANGVRANLFCAYGGDLLAGHHRRAFDERMNANTCDGLLTAVEKHRLPGRALPQERRQDLHGRRPQGTKADAAAFAQQPDCRRCLQRQICHRHLRSFTGTCPGVVEEQQQRVVPPPLRGVTIGGC
jgi:hypothetical protein